jgi:hypothetical protein
MRKTVKKKAKSTIKTRLLDTALQHRVALAADLLELLQTALMRTGHTMECSMYSGGIPEACLCGYSDLVLDYEKLHAQHISLREKEKLKKAAPEKTLQDPQAVLREILSKTAKERHDTGIDT